MTIEDVVAAVRIWQTQREEVFKRRPYDDGASHASLVEFAEILNGCTRKLISAVRIEDPDFWQALMELCGNAPPVLKGGKTFVNRQDVTTQVQGRSV